MGKAVNREELRRLHEAATQGNNWQEEVAFGEAYKANLPALLDELEAAREELRRLTQAVGDLRTGRDRAVKEAQRG